MRILQVLAGGEHGGAETAFVDACIAMHEAGEVVEVATRANDLRVPQLTNAGITVHTLPFGGKIDFWTGFRLKSIIKTFKPDIVQTWMSRASSHVPKWSNSMGIPQYLNVARLGGYYKLKYFKNIDYFVPITPDIGRHLQDGGIAAERIQHISNFAETEEVVTPLKRSDYSIPEDAPLLLGLGRLHTAKAFDTLIKVVSRMDGVYLWIAGEGPMREELEELITDLGVQDRVKLLGWRSDRAALFQASDICVFSSRYEPFGTVFVQSWAQKTPLVTTTAAGPKQFVRHEDDGLVVEIDDETAMQGAIQCLIDDKALAKTLVQNGRKRYEDEFTKEKMVSSYLSFFTQIRNTENLS